MVNIWAIDTRSLNNYLSLLKLPQAPFLVEYDFEESWFIYGLAFIKLG